MIKQGRKEGIYMKQKNGLQMSSSLPVMILLNLSGGTQDACSYFLRDHVFANAQTGNIVLMGCHLISKNLKIPSAIFSLLPFLHWGYLWPVWSAPVFAYRKDPLAPPGIDHRDYTAVYRWFYPGTAKLACKWAYLLCLCHAGTVFPYSKRKCLCQHHVYWKPAKRHGSFL